MEALLRRMDRFTPPRGRPVWILLILTVGLALADGGSGYFLRLGTIFSVTQLFATFGLVALGLGCVMMTREYDMSLAGSFVLAGVVAVVSGAEHPLLGVALGIAVGIAAGLTQGLLVVWLRIPAIALTLGGLLLMLGLTYALAGGENIEYPNRAVTDWLQESVLYGTISHRCVIVVAAYILSALIFAYTRIGRDVIATGSNRAGAAIAGVNTSVIVVAVLAAAGGMAGLGGALLSYSLAAASAVGLSDVLVPATAAVIIGGISLNGGKGRPLGIAAGMLTLCVLRSGLSAIGSPPNVLDTTTGAVLLVVAMSDGTRFQRRMSGWRRRSPFPRARVASCPMALRRDADGFDAKIGKHNNPP